MAVQPSEIRIPETSTAPDPRPFQRVVAGLIDRIVAGELTDGDRLPGRAELGGVFGATDASVARALGLVETLGFVETDEAGCAFVCARPALDFGLSLKTLQSVDGATVARLMVTLLYVEPSLAALAASNATHQDLIDLRDSLRRAAYATPVDRTGRAGHDACFHDLVGRASQNPAFAYLVAAIRSFLNQSRSGLHVVAPADVRGVQEQHNRIYQAIKERDPRAAYDAMQGHTAHWIAQNVELFGELHRWGSGGGRVKRRQNGVYRFRHSTARALTG